MNLNQFYAYKLIHILNKLLKFDYKQITIEN